MRKVSEVLIKNKRILNELNTLTFPNRRAINFSCTHRVCVEEGIAAAAVATAVMAAAAAAAVALVEEEE